MNVYIRTEFLILIGVASASLITAFLWLLVWFVKHLTSFAKALSAHAEVNAAQAQELLANVTARREEREACERRDAEQQAVFEAGRQKWRADLNKLRADSEAASALQSAELIKMKGAQAQMQRGWRNCGAKRTVAGAVTTLEAEAKPKMARSPNWKPLSAVGKISANCPTL
jgi:cell wall assembly regulator SMI1